MKTYRLSDHARARTHGDFVRIEYRDETDQTPFGDDGQITLTGKEARALFMALKATYQKEGEKGNDETQ